MHTALLAYAAGALATAAIGGYLCERQYGDPSQVYKSALLWPIAWAGIVGALFVSVPRWLDAA
jgi:hypothetical protein